MKVRQYASLSVFSESVSVDDISETLGMAPDGVTVRGSRSVDPPLPRFNRWDIEVRDSGLRVDEQLRLLIERAGPIVSAIRSLVDRGSCGAALQVVRYFGSGEEESPEVVSVGEMTLQRLAGQHQLLGWHLEPEVVRFMAETGCELDVDEYG